jgi:hypothetical protein
LFGAGEGNRTLVFSLEGFRRLNTFKAHSDKRQLKGKRRSAAAFRMMS